MSAILNVVLDGALIADNVWSARRFRDRLRGLLDQRELRHGAGLLLDPGGSVHTFGMRFSIDVIFVDERSTVLKTRRELKPNRTCWAPLGTRRTLELWAGACTAVGLQRGSRLVFLPQTDAQC